MTTSFYPYFSQKIGKNIAELDEAKAKATEAMNAAQFHTKEFNDAWAKWNEINNQQLVLQAQYYKMTGSYFFNA